MGYSMFHYQGHVHKTSMSRFHGIAHVTFGAVHGSCGSDQLSSKSHGSGPVGSRGLNNLTGRVGSPTHRIIISQVGSGQGPFFNKNSPGSVRVMTRESGLGRVRTHPDPPSIRAVGQMGESSTGHCESGLFLDVLLQAALLLLYVQAAQKAGACAVSSQ